MQPNEGKIDRTIRALLGVSFLIGAVLSPFPSRQQVILGLAAGIILLTAAVGTCPLYLLMRLNTNRHKPA